jgi:hypothetical protein
VESRPGKGSGVCLYHPQGARQRAAIQIHMAQQHVRHTQAHKTVHQVCHPVPTCPSFVAASWDRCPLLRLTEAIASGLGGGMHDLRRSLRQKPREIPALHTSPGDRTQREYKPIDRGEEGTKSHLKLELAWYALLYALCFQLHHTESLWMLICLHCWLSF